MIGIENYNYKFFKELNMKRLLAISAILIGMQASAFSVNHSGILVSRHALEVDENSVRIEMHNLNSVSVFSTGERRNREGELNTYSIKLEGVNEFEYRSWDMPFDIFNQTTGNNGGSGYISINRNDRLELYDGNRLNDLGVRPLKPIPWINARRGSRIKITIQASELDCSGQNVCNRGNDGEVVYEMTIPTLPRNLPSWCGGPNSLAGAVIDGEFQFAGMLDYSRVETGKPIIEPSINELDSFLCFLPVRE